MLIRTNKGACINPNFGATTVKNEVITPTPIVNVTVAGTTNEGTSMADCCASSGTSKLCFEVDPKTGRPIDPNSGLPFIPPTRKPFDPAPPQQTDPDPGTGTDGTPTINPDPPTTSPTPPTPAGPGEQQFDFLCQTFMLYGPDHASFTLQNADVKSAIRAAVAQIIPGFVPGRDKIISVGLDLEGLSYDGISVLPQQSQTWTFTDADGTKPVQNRIDRRGVGNYTLNVRVDSDRAFGLYFGPEGASSAVTNGQFAQSPNIGGIAPIGAAYCHGKVCSAVIKWGVGDCAFGEGEYIIDCDQVTIDTNNNAAVDGCTWHVFGAFGNPGNWLLPVVLNDVSYFPDAPATPSWRCELIGAGDYDAGASLSIRFYHPDKGFNAPFLSAEYELLAASNPAYQTPIDQFLTFDADQYVPGEGFQVRFENTGGRAILVQARFYEG